MTLYLLLIACLVSPARSSANWTADVTVPQDQLGCGSCYGFAITTVLEYFAAQVTDKPIIPLSTQFYVDCFGGNGCAGGILTDNLKYFEEYQYHPYKDDYGFTGYYSQQNCIDGGYEDRSARNALADVWLLKYQKIAQSDDALGTALDRGPTINGMYVSNGVFDWTDNGGEGIVDAPQCGIDANAHAWSFVGYTANKYIIKGSYGGSWASNGFANYAKSDNVGCNYYANAYTVHMAKRKEIQYKIGTSKKKWEDAQAACVALNTADKSGWTLAIIPTRMHAYEVYKKITDKYGDVKKADATFNYIWIGIRTATLATKVWADNTTPIIFDRYTSTPAKKFIKMEKFAPNYAGMRGMWTSEAKGVTLRYMCSRYRAEECPRISQTAVENARELTFQTLGGSTTLEITTGFSANVVCMEGYTLSGSATALCQSDGTWETLPACNENEEDS